MKNKKESLLFLIPRLDKEKKSSSISNIYYLSVLNFIKEIYQPKDNKIKNYFHNLIKDEKPKKLNQNKKMNILHAVKKTILSTNLSYKWRLISYKRAIINMHIRTSLYRISTFFIFHNIIDFASDIFTSFTKTNDNLNSTTSNLNNTFINYTNYTNTNESINNSTIGNIIINLLEEKTDKHNNIFFHLLLSNLYIIPFWCLLFFRHIPKRNKIDNIIYKITNYLLYIESLENNNYFYYLMEDYSIFVTKKEYMYKMIKTLNTHESFKNIDSQKNIFLYCVNIIDDYLLDGNNKISYFQLLSNEDKTYINELMKYISNNSKEHIKNYYKEVIKPFVFALLIFIYNHYAIKTEINFLGITCLLLVIFFGIYFFRQYHRAHNRNIDLFIDNYNDVLITKKRFIYKKGDLIMFFGLKDNIYSKKQIISMIEYIIYN